MTWPRSREYSRLAPDGTVARNRGHHGTLVMTRIFIITSALLALTPSVVLPALAQGTATKAPEPPLAKQINDGKWLPQKEAEVLRDNLYYQRAVFAYQTMLPALNVIHGTGVEFFDQPWKPDDVVKVKSGQSPESTGATAQPGPSNEGSGKSGR